MVGNSLHCSPGSSHSDAAGEVCAATVVFLITEEKRKLLYVHNKSQSYNSYRQAHMIGATTKHVSTTKKKEERLLFLMGLFFSGIYGRTSSTTSLTSLQNDCCPPPTQELSPSSECQPGRRDSPRCHHSLEVSPCLECQPGQRDSPRCHHSLVVSSTTEASPC